MFILMHSTNFPQHYENSVTLYIILIFGINLPWTLSCCRNYIVVPTSSIQRYFVIVFDTLVTKAFFRNHPYEDIVVVDGGEEPFAEIISWWKDTARNKKKLPENVLWMDKDKLVYTGNRPLKKKYNKYTVSLS